VFSFIVEKVRELPPVSFSSGWHEKGRAEEKIEARQKVICKYLARRFGADSFPIQEVE
jgi:hypothetical protein